MFIMGIIFIVYPDISFTTITYILSILLIINGIYFIATSKRFCQNRLTTTLYYALQVRYMENILVQDATFFEKFQLV